MKHIVILVSLYLVALFAGAQSFVSTNLPLVVIDTKGQAIIDGYKITADMKIISNPSGVNRLADAGNIYNGKIGIEIRGRYSASLPQKPYGFETRDALGNNLNVSLLGMASENDWILLANYNDKSFVRNALAFQMFRNNGGYAPHTALCEVFINGSYQGIYVLTEKIKVDKSRVNISKMGITDNTGDAVTGGYIFSVDYYEGNDSWMGSFPPPGYPNNDVYFVYNYPEANEITAQQKVYIRNFVYNFESALYSPGFANPATGYRNYINVNSFINYLIVNEVARNVDGYKKSCFYHKDRNSVNGKLNAGPVWDFDWAWKNIPECYFGVTDGSGWAYEVLKCEVWPTPTGWIPRLMEDPQFIDEVKQHYSALRKTTLSNTYLLKYVDSVNVLVADAQVRHYQKWPILGQNVGAPEIGSIPTTFAGETYKFKNWINTRLNWLDKQWLVPVTSVDDPAQASVKIYPNPAHGYVELDAGKTVESIEIFNQAGILVHAEELVQQQRYQVNINELKPGMYILKVKFPGGGVLSQKLLVN